MRLRDRLGDGVSLEFESFEVKRERFPEKLKRFLLCVARRDDTGDVRRVRSPVLVTLLQNHNILFHLAHFHPACLKMLLSVFFGGSALSLPAIVTRLFLEGCLYCRWLPLVRTRIQSSASSLSIISRTFKHIDYTVTTTFRPHGE